MKKKILFILPFLLLLTSCKTGREEPMRVQSDIIRGTVKDTEEIVYLLHCTKDHSLYNYYIEVPADIHVPAEINTKYTGHKVYYSIPGDDKVTNHGWVYIE